MKCYTGVGSRRTPQRILDAMVLIGERLASMGYCLRSGGAEGADRAFEDGCDIASGRKRIYVPWDGFQGNAIDNMSVFPGVDDHSMSVAEKYHPAWHRVGRAGRKLMARNTYQVLDWDEDNIGLEAKASMLVCWTPDGATGTTTTKTGGTGQAIRIAGAHGVRIFNLQKTSHLNHLLESLEDHNE